MTSPRNKPSPTVSNLTVLVDIRRDLEAIIQRVDHALGDTGETPPPRSPRRFQMPATQTFPEGYDFRDNIEGLRKALVDLYDRTTWVGGNLDKFHTSEALYQEMCLLAAKARLFQIQAEENSREWETAVGVIRSLTRIVADTKPGFVYGLASTHNTNWGAKIRELLETYRPVE